MGITCTECSTACTDKEFPTDEVLTNMYTSSGKQVTRLSTAREAHFKRNIRTVVKLQALTKGWITRKNK